MQVTTASALLPLLLLLLASALVLAAHKEQDDTSWGVFAFASGSSGTVDRWSRFDWDKMDTVAMFGDINQDLIDYAHSRGGKVVRLVNFDSDGVSLLDPGAVQAWIDEKVLEAIQFGFDGVNLDFESVIPPESEEASLYTGLIEQLVAAFHAAIPGSEVSVDVAWTEPCIDGRCYQYGEIGRLADAVFVMAYDLQSQIWDQHFNGSQCYARANSPLDKITEGIQRYVDIGIEPSKLILGNPWYGYDYTCLELEGDRCTIEAQTWRGCNCSDIVGTQNAYKNVLSTLLPQSEEGRKWDEQSQTPYFNFQDEEGVWHQVWYDDPESLALKYDAALSTVAGGLGVRGVGMWNADQVDYEDQQQVDEMWGAIPMRT